MKKNICMFFILLGTIVLAGEEGFPSTLLGVEVKITIISEPTENTKYGEVTVEFVGGVVESVYPIRYGRYGQWMDWGITIKNGDKKVSKVLDEYLSRPKPAKNFFSQVLATWGIKEEIKYKIIEIKF